MIAQKRVKEKKYNVGESVMGYVFALPWLAGLAIIFAYPLISSVYYSLTNYDINWMTHDVIGFRNFRFLLTDNSFWESTRNTVIFVIISVPTNLFWAFLAAVFLSYKTKFIKVYRVMFYLPTLVTFMVVVLLWQWIFNPGFGPINTLLRAVGVPEESLPGWFSDSWARLAIVIMGWWSIGGVIIIMLASILDVPTELHEAAKIDGAGVLRRLWKITLPMMAPIIWFNALTGMIGAFQNFLPSYVITGGLFGTNFLGYLIFQEFFVAGNMGFASAAAWLLLVVILVFAIGMLLINKFLIHYMDE